jgi:hypothetical protein
MDAADADRSTQCLLRETRTQAGAPDLLREHPKKAVAVMRPAIDTTVLGRHDAILTGATYAALADHVGQRPAVLRRSYL